MTRLQGLHGASKHTRHNVYWNRLHLSLYTSCIIEIGLFHKYQKTFVYLGEICTDSQVSCSTVPFFPSDVLVMSLSLPFF